MSKNTIFTILAVIGGLVVFGWVLRFTFALLGPLALVGVGIIAYLALSKNKRIGGPK
ncbi:MAG: hypothetical protein WC803_06095 [Sphingomonas sp.]